jgi:hypothetical protein
MINLDNLKKTDYNEMVKNSGKHNEKYSYPEGNDKYVTINFKKNTYTPSGEVVVLDAKPCVKICHWYKDYRGKWHVYKHLPTEQCSACEFDSSYEVSFNVLTNHNQILLVTLQGLNVKRFCSEYEQYKTLVLGGLTGQPWEFGEKVNMNINQRLIPNTYCGRYSDEDMQAFYDYCEYARKRNY